MKLAGMFGQGKSQVKINRENNSSWTIGRRIKNSWTTIGTLTLEGSNAVVTFPSWQEMSVEELTEVMTAIQEDAYVCRNSKQLQLNSQDSEVSYHNLINALGNKLTEEQLDELLDSDEELAETWEWAGAGGD